jgi:hypothetical protein
LDFGFRDGVGGEERVREGFAQGDLELALLHAGKGGEVDLQNVGEFEEERGGDVALVVLDEVEIARGNTEFLGETLLGEALLHAQAADGFANGSF